ncbi:hypothetical protein [Streptomyces sp. NPDC059063]|uniref:hypothetical protein n=1 Tax=unclassified Streptomyces TaxID=2593676 RepID=UPI0036C9488C
MERWDRVGRCAGYAGALALSPYLLIKVSWVVGSLLGLVAIGDGFSLAGWVLLNTVTIGMAGIGIALSLALVRPWGMRIPGWLVGFCSWTGAGFLVAVLPYAVVTALLDAAPDDSGGGSDDPAMPGWEAALVQIGFVGMGLGLAVALPAHLRRRWPDAFAGRVGDSARGADGGDTGWGRVPWPAVVAAAVGLAWLYWAVGGTLGIVHPDERTTEGALLTGLGALWALVGAAAVRTLALARPARLPRWLPLALGWIGSGSLFAWSAWRLPLTVFVAVTEPADVVPPENPTVAVVLHLAAVVAGVGMVRTLLAARPTPHVSRSLDKRAGREESPRRSC